MIEFEKLTNGQGSLLMYLETRAVDFAGRVNGPHMNADDFADAALLDKEGVIKFGRICSNHVTSDGANWVELLDPAWEYVAKLRRAKAVRMFTARQWMSTAEKRAAEMEDAE